MQCAANRHTGRCPAEARFAEAKGQGSQHKCWKVIKKKKIVLLGSSHGRGMGPVLQENLGSKFEVCSIFKANATLAKVVENVRKLGKDLTKQDHIVAVRGAGNSLVIISNI
jgi:hypothetical protein